MTIILFKCCWNDVGTRLRTDSAEPLLDKNAGLEALLEFPFLRDLKPQILDERVNLGDENSEVCTKLREMHEKTFANLRTRFPELRNGDGFAGYLEDRDRREHKEDYRKTGSQCIHCGSENVTSYGKEWLCKSCGRRFRKANQTNSAY